MDVIPDELWLYIANILSLKDLISFSGVSCLSNAISKSVLKWSRLEVMRHQIKGFRNPYSVDQVKGWPNIAFLVRLYYPEQVSMISQNSLYQCYGHFSNVYFSIHNYRLRNVFCMPTEKRIYSLEYSILDDDFSVCKKKSIPHITYNPNRDDNEESLKKIIIPKKSFSVRYSNITDLTPFSHLQSISIVYCEWLRDISPIKDIPKISIVYCNQIASIDCLGSKQSTLQINGCDSIRNFDTIGNIPNIDLTWNIITSLDFLGKGVTELSVKGCVLFNLEEIRAAENLEILDLSQCIQIEDITPLSSLKKLRSLQLRECNSITDIIPLSSLKNLEILDISYVTVDDINPLIDILPPEGKLNILKMWGCPNIKHFSPLFKEIILFGVI